MPAASLSDEIAAALSGLGLLRDGETFDAVALPGGVSSDIVRVDLPGRTVCVKRALPRLKVAATWEAPVERNASEAEWMRVAGDIVPQAVPDLLAEDRDAGLFVMAYLDGGAYPLWKTQLLEGRIDPRTARAVGSTLVKIHAATADDDDIARRFANDHIFGPIRLEPYLLATAAAHPDLAQTLGALAVTTRDTKRVLVHGDVSPKNILAGPEGPVFLDAECAWYGDPAFDLAFCLNHLLLKCVWRPDLAHRYIECFDTMAFAYLSGVAWEPADDIESRAAALLPGLMLARIDGKSPVEYITEDDQKTRVRGFARAFLREATDRLDLISRRWQEGFQT